MGHQVDFYIVLLSQLNLKVFLLFTGLNTAEKYDPSNQEWRAIAAMSTRRSSVGVGVLHGLIYAVFKF